MRRGLKGDNLLLGAIAVGKLLLNLAVLRQYGWFRDELYYIACSEHLAWGYVDQPPLSIAVLALTRALGGDSMVAIRLPAVLAGAAVVFLTGLIARRLGGGRAAQVIAALAAALSPVILGNAGRTYSMNAFDLLFWAWALYLVVVLLEQERPRLWVAFGAVAGLGLLNKYSMLFLGFGLVVGLLLTAQRRQLLSRWIWLGGVLAAALFLPHLIWEVNNGWPSIEFIRTASQQKNIQLSPLAFLLEQILMVGFLQALLCIAGLVWLGFHRDGRRLRALAWLYPAVFAVMVLNGAKAYYLTPAYALYLAAGAVWFEGITAGARSRVRPVFALIMTAASLVVLPFAIPCLPVEQLVAYSRAIGFEPRAEENHELAELPQYYADQFGWPEFVEQVAGISQQIAPQEREHAVIYVRNYGEAAAIDFLGRHHGLPPVLCAHNSYWFWGPGDTEMEVAIVLGGSRSEDENLADLEGPGRFGRCKLAGVTDCHWCMPFERHRQWFVCRDPEFSFREIWDGERFFY